MVARASTADQEQYDDEPQAHSPARFMLAVPSWLVSMVTHLVLLTMLGLCYFQIDAAPVDRVITALPTPPAVDEIEVFEPPTIEPPIETKADIQQMLPPSAASAGGVEPLPAVAIETSLEVEAEMTPIEVFDPDSEIARPEDLGKPRGGAPSVGYNTRDPANRKGFLDPIVGTTGPGEAAVANALRWLALHQRPNGSWSFDHRHGPCKTNPGGLTEAYNGATGITLLTFLGAGQTHREGSYKAQVAGGLDYLVRSMKLEEGQRGDLSDAGTMYSHGICSIALCEAYAMTNDRKLLAPAQASINYIVYAQDPVGGGWRYSARQPGDTSVVGWQLMALKSGHMAYLHVPANTVKGASQFLDSVQVDSGAGYGYTSAGDGLGTTSVGLLCRMYLGWKKDHGALERGVARLSKTGPSKTNLYYNYYATQILRHYGGEPWKKWNSVMRDQAIDTQSQQGAEKGSWYIAGDHGSDRGGRIYCTAMSTMILEVYYRQLPIFQTQASEDDFAL